MQRCGGLIASYSQSDSAKALILLAILLLNNENLCYNLLRQIKRAARCVNTEAALTKTEFRGFD